MLQPTFNASELSHEETTTQGKTKLETELPYLPKFRRSKLLAERVDLDATGFDYTRARRSKRARLQQAQERKYYKPK